VFPKDLNQLKIARVIFIFTKKFIQLHVHPKKYTYTKTLLLWKNLSRGQKLYLINQIYDLFRKDKLFWILTKQNIMEWHWTICKSLALHSRYIIIPALHQSTFYRLDALLMYNQNVEEKATGRWLVG